MTLILFHQQQQPKTSNGTPKPHQVCVATRFITLTSLPTWFVTWVTDYVKFDVLPTQFVTSTPFSLWSDKLCWKKVHNSSLLCLHHHNFCSPIHTTPPLSSSLSSPPSLLFSLQPPPPSPQWGTANAEIKVSSVQNPQLWKGLPLKPWEGHNKTIYALSTNFFLSNLYFSGPFNFFFFFFFTKLQGRWSGLATDKAGQATFWHASDLKSLR